MQYATLVLFLVSHVLRLITAQSAKQTIFYLMVYAWRHVLLYTFHPIALQIIYVSLALNFVINVLTNRVAMSALTPLYTKINVMFHVRLILMDSMSKLALIVLLPV